jgi:hypothetical protein
MAVRLPVAIAATRQSASWGSYRVFRLPSVIEFRRDFRGPELIKKGHPHPFSYWGDKKRLTESYKKRYNLKFKQNISLSVATIANSLSAAAKGNRHRDV